MKRKPLITWFPFRFALLIAPLMAAWPQRAQAVTVDWEGLTGGTPGDGIFWSDAFNWQGDALPLGVDTVTFGAVGTGGSRIMLDAARTVNDLSFDETTTLGSFGTTLGLTNTTGNISVSPGTLATVNAPVFGATGLNLSGGGSLYLTNSANAFTGNATINGPGTRLVIAYPGQPSPVSRSNAFALGQANNAINLTNGGELRLLGSGLNLDGTVKTINLGSGGSALNIAAGYQQMTIDDAGQIVVAAGATAPTLIKNGNGRLTINSVAYNLAANLTVNAGLIDFANSAATVAATAGGQPNRFTAFTGSGFATGTTTTINLNGGMLVGNSGTASMIDAPTINFGGGTFAPQGADHELGTRITITAPIPAATTINFLSGTTSNLLLRDAFTPTNARLPRVHGVLNGTGNLNLIGATGNAVNSRTVFEHGDQTTGNFTGTIFFQDITALESQGRYGSTTGAQGIGNTIGKATLDFRGWNNTLDLRDDGTGNNLDLSTGRSDYTSNNLRINTTVGGAISRLAVNRVGTTANTNNVFHLNDLSFSDSQRLVLTGGNGYGTRFNTLTLGSGTRPAISPILDLLSSKLEINGPINEAVSGDGLIKRGGDALNLSGAAALSSVDVKNGTLRLFGAGGSLTPGSLSGTGSLTINGGVSGNAAGVVVLDNNAANTGGSVAAANNGDRIADSIRITTRSDAGLSLISLNNAAGAETVGPVTAQGGYATFTATQTGTNAGGTALTLSSLTLNGNAVANYTGSTLGTSAGSGKVFLTGAPATGAGAIHGVQHVVNGGTDWAIYGANGFTNFASYGTLTPGGAAQAHTEINAATVALTGGESAQTLKLSGATAATLDTAGQLFALTDGGIISSGPATNVISGTALGGLTAGTAGAQSLYVTNANELRVNAIVADNAGGGPVTLVKSGTGNLVLSNQAVPSFPADHTNTFSGGLVINSGTVTAHRVQYLGTKDITLNGGTLDINAGTDSSLNNAAVNVGNNVIVNGNSNLVWDNTGDFTGGGSGFNVQWNFGSLTVNNGAIFGIGGWDNDVRFAGATLSGNPVFNLNADRGDGNNNIVIAGNLAGGGFSVEAINAANAGRVNRLTLGDGSTDTIANTYSGNIFIGRTSTSNDPTLQLNKANGTTAITGDVTINGGNLYWGPSATLTNNSHISENSNTASANRFQGNSIVTSIYPTTSGNNQIADASTINLLAGSLNESSRYTFETFSTLNQRNGTFNTGTGRIEVGTYNQWGGNLAFNSGGTFVSGTATLLPGAQDVTIANNFAGGQTTWEVGSGGLTLNQQNITIGNGSYTLPAGGAVLKLGGSYIQQFTPLNGSTVRAIQTGGAGRELARNNFLDLAGGTRTFSIDSNIFQTIHGPIIQNGGIIKTGGGVLSVMPWNANTFAGGVTVNEGIYIAKGASAFGSGAVTIASGGTAKLDGGYSFSNAVTVSGPGSYIPGESGANGIREQGALFSESGLNRLTGGVTIAGGATIASNNYTQPTTATPVNTTVASAAPFVSSLLRIESDVTGTGSLTLSGGGDGVITGGLNTTGGGLIKTGGGTWNLRGAGSYTGATLVEAGTLAISNGGALGSAAQGTTVAGGATLALTGGVSSLEPLTLHGNGATGGIAGALSSSGINTLRGAINLVSTQGTLPYIRSQDGTLTLAGTVSGSEILTLGGAGNGTVIGNATLGGLTKTGSGTWNLNSAANSLGAQAVTVLGGNLGVASGLNAAAPLSLSGGNFTNLGSPQTVASLAINGIGGSLNGGSGLNVGAITRAPGSAAGFQGSITTSTGSLGGWAYSGADFAKVSAGAVVPFAAGDYTTLLAPAGNNVIPSIALPAQNTNYGYDGIYASPVFGGIDANSLRVSSNLQGLATDGSAMTLGSGGLMTTGSGTFNLGGSGLLSGATAADDLIIHAQRDTNISNPLIGAGAGNLVKTGSGQLNLFGVSSFTGSVNISGGLLGVSGQQNAPGALGGALTAANRTINLGNGGGLYLTTGSWDLNDHDLVTAGIQSLVINIGAGGGTLRSRDGQILINDTNGQFGGTGDLTIAGGGRISLEQAYNFTGDTTVTGGVLRLTNTGALGTSSQQTITMGAGTSLIAGAALNQAFNFQSSEISPVGGDRQFLGPVSFSGTNRIVTVARDNLGSAQSLGFHGNISGSGTLDLYGINSNARVQFGNGVNTFTGDINLNANTTLEARLPGSIGSAPGAITLNFLGANSGVRVRHYQNGDYNANLNVRNNVEFQFGRHENFGAGAQQLLSFNNLTVASGNRWITTNADNGYWLALKGTATAAGNLTVNLNSGNMLLEQGITIAGTLDKRGSGFLATRGAVTADKVLLASGLLDLRGGASLTATNGVELRGGSLQISQDVDGGANPNRYTGSLTLGGGVLRVIGDTNLGTITAVPGQTDVFYTSSTQGNTQTPLVLTGFTRSSGSQINFGTDFGTLGRESTTISNARILLPGQADTFGTGAIGSTDIIPWARVVNEFAGYRTQTDLGTALGVFPVTNTFMQLNPAEGAFAANIIARFDAATTTTMTANRSVRALKMDGTATRTIDIGAANILTVERGAVIHVGVANNRIGIAATGGKIQAGAGVSELFLTSNGAELQIGAGIQNNGATALSLVKNGAGTLLFDGTAATSANTFTGDIHLNAGLLANTRANHIPATATINFNGGRWEPRIDPAAVGGGSIALGNNIVVNSSSLSLGGDPALSLDNGATATNVNGTFQLGKLTINNAATWSVAGWDQMDATFTAPSGQQHLFNGSGGIAPTIESFQGRTSAAAGESVFTFAGAMTGDTGLNLTSRGLRGATPSHTVIVLGGGATDTAANNFGGVLEVGLTTNGSDTGTIVRLNKAAGTNAIGSQGVIIGGGSLRNEANEQIADTADVTINGYASSNVNYGWALNGKTETIGSLTQNGGNFGTGLVLAPNLNSAIAGGSLIVSDNGGTTSGKLTITGGGGINNDVFTLNSTSTVTAKSVEVTKYGRIVVTANSAATDTVLTVGTGGLTMEGTQILITDGLSTNSRVVLNGDVTTLAATIAAALSTASESDNRLDLGGAARVFNIADGGAGDDLAINLTVQNGALTKTGAGTLVLGGSSLFHSNALNANSGGANTYAGPTLVAGGELHLNKTAGTNAVSGSSVQVGNLSGPASLVLRNSNQIVDTAAVSLAAGGIFDLQTYNASEAVGNLTSTAGGTTRLGPGSALTVNVTSDSVYAGSIIGGGNAAGAVTLAGSAKWSLNGNNEYSGDTVVNGGNLEVNGLLNGSEITVNAGGTLSGIGTVSDVVLNGGTLAPGNSPGLLNMRNFTTTAGTYLVDIAGTGMAANGSLYDVAKSTGTVNLGAGVTALTLNLTYAPSLGDAFWPILNDGLDPIIGTFAGLPEGGLLVSGPYSFQITYLADGTTTGPSTLTGGNDVALLTVAVPETTSVGLLGLTALLTLRRRRRSA